MPMKSEKEMTEDFELVINGPATKMRFSSDPGSELPGGIETDSRMLSVEEAAEEEQPIAEVPIQPGENSEEDHITQYLREVSGYPLLTQSREAELAQIIRHGLDELVYIIEEYAGEQEIFIELSEKVRKLLKLEKTFPGARDKAFNVIVRTLKHGTQAKPHDPYFSGSFARVEAILKAVDSARQEMVRANLRLVLSIAKRFRGRGMTFDDLIQEGNIGLLKAAGRFDHTKGNRFSTYATLWVRQSIIRGIYDKSRTIRLPVYLIELKNRFFKVYYELLKELGREPTSFEIAERLDLPVEKVQMVLALSARPISLEAPIGEHGQCLRDLIEDDRGPSPVDECRDRELAEITRALISSLQPREEKILRLRFGLDGHPAETLASIGKIFNLSRERIRQIEKKALHKLKDRKRSLHNAGYERYHFN
jgi:RNA polymerase primary sigma factor